MLLKLLSLKVLNKYADIFSKCVLFVILCIVYFLRFIYVLYESDSRAVGTKFSTDILNE
jgi:hypothetical protein